MAMCLFIACAESDRARVTPKTSSSDGVEIAQVPELPSVLRSDFTRSFDIVRELRTVRDGTVEPSVYDPAGILPLRNGAVLVDDPAGDFRLVTLDGQSGAVVNRFGRSGRGSGELGARLHLSEAPDGTLLVVDETNRQIHHFARGGDWIKSVRVPIDGFLVQVRDAPERAGFLVETFEQDGGSWRRNLVSLTPEGAVTTFARFPEPTLDAEPGELQGGRALWAVVGGGVVTMWSSRAEVRFHAANGSLVRRIELGLTRRHLTGRDVDEQVRLHGSIARSLRTGPAALTNMLYPVGDSIFGMLTSRLWRAKEDPAIPRGDLLWRLFDVRGEYLGVVVQPDDMRFLGRGDDTIWIRTLDEVGVPILRELRLARRRS